MNIGNILIIFIIIIISMVLHELAHGYVAYWLGDDTAKDEGRLSLNPLVHLDPVMSVIMPLLLFISGAPVFGGAKPVPVNTKNLKGGAWGMALVALAGPLTNFILAFVGVVIGRLTGCLIMESGSIMYTTQNIWGFVLSQFVFANLGFALFNLIPIPPLDGSRVLYAIAPDRVRDLLEALETTLGIVIVLVLVMFFRTALSTYLMTTMNAVAHFFFTLTGA